MPKNREEARKRFVHQQNGVPCGVFLHTFLHRLWKSFALLCGKRERECGLAPAWLASPCRCCPRRGAWRFWLPVDFAAVVPEGVACFLCCLPTLPSVYFSAPYPPDPLPRRGRGRFFCFLMQGASPLASPGLNLRFAAKPTEFLYLERCRQPRRGGTGGDGTIRRTRRRRLRWSSPPGQIEQVPRVACFLCRLPTLPSVYFLLPLSPQPPSPAGKGETQSLFRRGRSPRHPGTEPLAALTEPAKQVPSGGELARRCRLPPPPSRRGACPHVFLSMP